MQLYCTKEAELPASTSRTPVRELLSVPTTTSATTSVAVPTTTSTTITMPEMSALSGKRKAPVLPSQGASYAKWGRWVDGLVSHPASCLTLKGLHVSAALDGARSWQFMKLDNTFGRSVQDPDQLRRKVACRLYHGNRLVSDSLPEICHQVDVDV